MSRILVITTSYPSLDDDCAGHFVLAEVDRLLAEGHDVTVLAPRARRTEQRARVIDLPHLGAFGSPGALARLRGRPDRWVGAFLFVLTARLATRRLAPSDRTIAHFILPSFWPIAASNPGRVEAVIHGSDLRLLERLPAFVRKRVLRPRAGVERSFRCVSTELAERLAKWLPSQEAQAIRIAPSPIHIPVLPDKAALRRSLNVGTEKLVVVVSRLIPSKRVHVALRAATATSAKVVVCGSGPERAPLHREFPEVHFCGQVPRARALEWLAASDVVLSASIDEGAPTVVREARALGVPVVAMQAGDLTRWAENDPGITVVKRRPNRDQIPRQDQDLIRNLNQEQNLNQEEDLTQALLRILNP